MGKMIWRCDLSTQADNYLENLLEITRRVLASGRYVLGQEVEEFEKAFASYVGTKHCVAVANGTDALVLALKVSRLSQKAEVITTPFTAIPTISAIVEAGCKPVFVDIDPDTFLIDIEQIPSAFTKNTQAIIPVHLFTQMVDIERLRALLPRPVTIIEDAAQAHGCRLRGAMAGTLGDLAAFSFYPTKNLGGYGDGGAVVTNNPTYDHELRLLRNYGKQTNDNIIMDGVNSRLDELQAAYLQLKLRDLEAMNAKRCVLAQIYREELHELPVALPAISGGSKPNYHVFVVKVLEQRDELKEFLAQQQIQTDIFYPHPHHLQPAYQRLGYAAGDFQNAEAVSKQVLALPLYPELNEEKIREICGFIRIFFGVK